MPAALLRPCAYPGGCPALTDGTYCPDHRAWGRRGARPSASRRGYGTRWQSFRARVLRLLVRQDIPPVCGATLPGGPRTQDSACRAAGVLVAKNPDGSGLHLDHEPPLQPHEREDVDAVCDPSRVQLLCASCHARKTARQS